MDVLDSTRSDVAREIVLEGFQPRYGRLEGKFASHPLWARMRSLGSELWLDTGDIDAAGQRWTREFTALTTNNSLLNKEVQRGAYDDLVRRATQRLRTSVPDLSEVEIVQELAFILNAYHGLRLVERFDAFVSVELHTGLATDEQATVAYGKRYHAICPERFIVKVPLTAEGLVAAHRLHRAGIPVNFTLGFSARQNVMISLIARPAFCNVFLGRLNQVVQENDLGDGQYVGERATAASQHHVEKLRGEYEIDTRQIAASLRSGEQVRDLAGVDVLTMPPPAASEFTDSAIDPKHLNRGIHRQYEPQWTDRMAATTMRVQTCWDVPTGLEAACAELGRRDLGDEPGWRLRRGLQKHGFSDVLPDWTTEDHQQARADGKIPKLERWQDRLARGEIGLDSLMTLHGLESFAADQAKMDDRIREHME